MTLSRINLALLGVAAALAAVVVADAVRGRPEFPDEVVWPAVAAEDVDGLRVLNPDGEVRLHRDGQAWRIDAPEPGPADPDLVRAVLRMFDEPLRPDVRVTAEVDDPAAYGFVDGERIELEVTRGDERLLGLELGSRLPGGSSFVRGLGEDAAYRARVAGRYRLERPPAAWRDHRVLGMTRGKLIGMTIEHPDATWHLERRTEDWACLETPELMLDARLVEGMARSLADLRASARVDEPPAGAFDDVVLRVTAISHEEGVATVEFGALADDGSERYARAGDRVFLVAEARVETFRPTPYELLDRDITKFDWREVQRVTVTLGERRFAAVPTGDRSWRLVEPEGYSLDARDLGFSLDALIKLRAYELLDAGVPAAATLDGGGVMRVVIDRTESRPLELRIAPAVGGLHAVQRTDRDRLYVIRESTARLVTRGFGLTL